MARWEILVGGRRTRGTHSAEADFQVPPCEASPRGIAVFRIMLESYASQFNGGSDGELL